MGWTGGWLNQRSIAQGRRSNTVDSSPKRHLHVPLPPRRDDTDRPGDDGTVRHPSARRIRTESGSGLCLLLHEWRIDPGASRPNPNEMTDFTSSRSMEVFPASAPLVAKLGDRVRIRIGNLGPMDHHPIHLHGYQFKITETDGGRIPESAQWPETTVLVPVGSTRTVGLSPTSRVIGDALPHDAPCDESDGS